MREIKFRAWDNKNKYMVDASWGNWVSFDGVAYEEANIKYNTPHIEIEKVKDLIIMQFTGFKDKSGVEIYEGDILSLWYSRDTTGNDIVKFDQTVEWEDTNGFSGWSIPFLESAEIIGNIYQNPELLTTPTRG